MQTITKNIYVETEVPECCNHSFVSTGEGVVMIDTPWLPTAAIRWREEIAGHGKILYIVNTEYHADHFGGNCFFGGVIVAHEGTRKGIIGASVEQVRRMLLSVRPDRDSLLNEFFIRSPMITFTKELTLYIGNYTFQLIEMPGHTPFETMVFVPEERVIFASDNVVTYSMPFFGHSLPYEWLQSLERLESIDFDLLVPGHGKICNKSAITYMKASIKASLDRVDEAISQGMTLNEAKDRVNLADLYPGLTGDRNTMKWLERMNVARLYAVLSGSEGRIGACGD